MLNKPNNAFIDSQNLYLGVQSEGWVLDYAKFRLYLKNKYKIQLLSEAVSLKEAIDGIAYTLDVSLVETDELKNIGITKGDSIELYDYAYDNGSYSRIFCGIIWDTDKDKKNKKKFKKYDILSYR